MQIYFHRLLIMPSRGLMGRALDLKPEVTQGLWFCFFYHIYQGYEQLFPRISNKYYLSTNPEK